MIYCFYHLVDLDGHCSGAIVKYFYKLQNIDIQLIPFNYGHQLPLDKFKKEDIVYFVDAVPQPFDNIFKIKELVDKVIVFDHHKSFIESVAGEYFATKEDSCLQIGIAGCEITWKKLFPERVMPQNVLLLGEYDSWRDQDKRHWSKKVLPFQYGMRIEKTDPVDNYELWELWFNTKLQQVRIENVIDKGNVVLKYETMQNENVMTNSFKHIFYDNSVPQNCICINSPTRNSNLFKSVWDEELYDYMIVYSETKRREWSFSAYTTKKGKDASRLAKVFGGGGHVGAAGWTLSKLEEFF